MADEPSIFAAAASIASEVISVSAPTVAASADDGPPLTRGQKLRLVGLVILKRLRFVAILAGVGLFICKWDMVMSYWDKWVQSRGVVSQELEPGHEFYCPMDPQVVRSGYEANGDVPKCPICGMPLSIRKKGEAAKLPEGVTGRVQLSPERVQLAGIKTEPVTYRPMARQTKTVGYVTFDESRLSRIVSRVDGYVEKLYVNETFAMVREGEPLAEIYSPELFSAARELVLAGRSGGMADLAAAARSKLLLLGVGREEIDHIAASGPSDGSSAQWSRLVIRSPRTGFVVEKKIVAGSSVEAKMTLLEVADLSTVWIEAEVYEKDIPYLEIGEQVEATVDAWPNRTFTGKLALIYPQVDAATRTNRVRLKLDNPKYELRPGMFATVRINTPLETIEPFKRLAANVGRGTLTAFRRDGSSGGHEFLTVPERAVIDTGSKKVVYVEREPGVFEGVEVQLGPRQDGFYPVVKGLNEGDKVAAAGGFLIDAETRLNPAAAATYFGASGGPQTSDRGGGLPATRRPSSDRETPERLKTKAEPKPRVTVAPPTPEELENIAQLSEGDRKPALAQRVCPITGAPLGSMGVPVKIVLQGKTVYLCCKGCIGKAKRNPDETLNKLRQ